MSNTSESVEELTEENSDKFELWQSTSTGNEEHSLEKNISSKTSASVLDTLRSIQEENPQIETIFIDSDEDEDELIKKPKIQIHDILTIPSSINQPTPVDLQGSNVGQTSPFMVRAISPSRLTSNLVRDSNTIVLQDESKGPSSRSYLVIPKEVFPLLARSKGPVALNVPGIGPLVIPKPSEIINRSGTNESKNWQIPLQRANNNNINHSTEYPNENIQNPVQNLNRTNISVNNSGEYENKNFQFCGTSNSGESENKDKLTVHSPNYSIGPVTKPPEMSVYNRRYDPLSDPKYCWRFRKGIKRDLDGFSLSDRLGFYKAEKKRSKICVVKCKENVKKLEYSINMLKRKLAALHSSKTDNIGSKRNNSLQNGNKITPKMDSKMLSPLQKKNLKTLLSWKERFEVSTKDSSTESEYNEIDNDLLVTKKVVLVKETRRRRKVRRKFSGFGKEKDHTYSMSESFGVKHDDFSDMLKSTEESHRNSSEERSVVGPEIPGKRTNRGKLPKRFVAEPMNNKEFISRKGKVGRPRKHIEPQTSTPTTPRKRGRPRKIKKEEKLSSDSEEVHNMIPCSVELSPVEIKQEALEKYEDYYKHEPKSCMLISSIQELQTSVDSSKPILVVNEKQCAKLDLTELCSTNNLIFPTSEIEALTTSFIHAAEACSIKFVKPDVLCKYLSGVKDTTD